MLRRRSKWYRRIGTKERGFDYEDAAGKRVTDKLIIARIKSLVIPPAWTDVLISPSASSKVQVVGHDTSGRMQYLYHTAFRERQQKKKFSKLLAFAEKLPFLRKRAKRDLRRSDLSKDRVLAVIIQLIDQLNFRVGSEKSVERYKTFGITTLRNRHLQIKPNGELQFDFVGKHHITHTKLVVDRKLAAILREIKSLRGSKLFNYVNDAGKIRPITARDVNEYIKRATDPAFTAKDFRTWGATVKAATHLAKIGFSRGERTIKKNIIRAIRYVAEHLGNTVAVSRGSYVHPTVIKKYEKGVTIDTFGEEAEKIAKEAGSGLDKEEAAVVALLKS